MVETKKSRGLRWRYAFTQAVTELADHDDRVLLAFGDLGRTYEYDRFSERHPDRLLDFGIAEQNAVSVLAGLAAEGYIPYFATFAPFASLRPLEQIRICCAYPHLPVRICGSDGGLSIYSAGSSHLGLEDLSVLRSIPEMLVIAPCDETELHLAVRALAEYDGPAYIRIQSEKIHPVYEQAPEFSLGKAIVHRFGTDANIIACGSEVWEAVRASARLAEDGFSVGVIDMHTLKPLDCQVIREALQHSKLIITSEENLITGGLGSAVAEVVAAENGGKVIRLGIEDRFPTVCLSYQQALEKCRLDADGIVQTFYEQKDLL